MERIPIAIIGVGYNALTSKEYLYGLLGSNGIFKAKATITEHIIATIYANRMSDEDRLILANPLLYEAKYKVSNTKSNILLDSS